MAHDPDAIRRLQAADARLDGLGIAAADRPAARRAMVKVIEAEEAAAAKNATAARMAQAAQAEAAAERQRIAAVVRAGRDTGRPRQALRLALAGPVTQQQAVAILGGLPVDAEAPAAALAVPGAGAFGGEAAKAERARLVAIFGNPTAAGHFRAACALALEGDAPADAVLALLAGLPPEAVVPRLPSIAERAAGLAEFGADASSGATRADRTADGWRSAVAAANRQIGAVTPGAAQPVAQVGASIAPAALGARA